MEIKEIKKRLKEIEKKLKPVTPAALSPKQLAERKAARLKTEQAKQKETAKIEKLKGKKILDGVAACPGLAMGRVRNVDEQFPELMQKIMPGEIVVADKLRAEHDAYIRKAAAFITNTGGVRSSIAIMAKVLGKPAVTGTIGRGEVATQILQTGQKVIVDGTEGAVYDSRQTI